MDWRTLEESLASTILASDLLARYRLRRRVERVQPSAISHQPSALSGLSEADSRELTADGYRFAAAGGSDVLDWLIAKEALSYEAYTALSDAAKVAAFSIARVEKERVVQAVQDELGRVMAGGGTVADFQEGVKALFETHGIAPTSDWHLETVYRTNASSAYGAAHWRELHEPGVAEMFPYYRYLTVGDARVREEHAMMHGLVFRADDPIWQTWWPPNGYNCRCWVEELTAEEAEAMEISEGVDLIERPAPGFRTNVGMEIG